MHSMFSFLFCFSSFPIGGESDEIKGCKFTVQTFGAWRLARNEIPIALKCWQFMGVRQRVAPHIYVHSVDWRVLFIIAHSLLKCDYLLRTPSNLIYTACNTIVWRWKWHECACTQNLKLRFTGNLNLRSFSAIYATNRLPNEPKQLVAQRQ